MVDWLKKLMFWKHEDEFAKLDRAYDPGLGETGAGGPGFEPGTEPFGPASQPAAFDEMRQHKEGGMLKKDIELISSKLDTIKLILDNMDRRIANLEKIAQGEQQRVRKEW